MGVVFDSIMEVFMSFNNHSFFSSLLSFEILFIAVFAASLLWTFGVHFVKLEEQRFLSYLGAATLSSVSSLAFWLVIGGLFGFISSYISHTAVKLTFTFLLIIHAPLLILLNIYYGTLIWQTSWKKSSSVWIIITIFLAVGTFIEIIFIWV